VCPFALSHKLKPAWALRAELTGLSLHASNMCVPLRAVTHSPLLAVGSVVKFCWACFLHAQIVLEANPTSNAFILGVEKDKHPLPVYLKAGVPVSGMTDPGAAHGHVITVQGYLCTVLVPWKGRGRFLESTRMHGMWARIASKAVCVVDLPLPFCHAYWPEGVPRRSLLGGRPLMHDILNGCGFRV
jgi:hypothetical protein